MLFRKIINGYGHILSSIIKVLLLAAVCVAFGFIVVFPLWKWATTFPSSYTAAVLSVCALIFLYYLVRFFIGKSFHSIIRIVLMTISIALMITLPIYFVINLHKLYALLALVISFSVFSIIKFGIKK